MSDPVNFADPLKAATVEQLRDYFEWHVQCGRGKYVPEVRAMYVMVPPQHETHDDATQEVFLKGFY